MKGNSLNEMEVNFIYLTESDTIVSAKSKDIKGNHRKNKYILAM